MVAVASDTSVKFVAETGEVKLYHTLLSAAESVAHLMSAQPEPMLVARMLVKSNAVVINEDSVVVPVIPPALVDEA